MVKKVYIVGYDSGVRRMFRDQLDGFSLVEDYEEADIVVFTGGEDVTPQVYGDKKHPTTGCNFDRDLEEASVFNTVSDRQLKVGICRGAQFLCVMNGGTLYQDVDRHAIYNTHTLTYVDAKGQESFHQVTSTHHQMQNPYIPQGDVDLTFELWGFAERCTYRDQGLVERKPLNANAHPDVEIVWWPETNSLGFQPHPEYGVEECLNLFKTCLNRAMDRMN
jgi:gamma-glutamyl-gamma-aminobutyrate hydrolase PuuD